MYDKKWYKWLNTCSGVSINYCSLRNKIWVCLKNDAPVIYANWSHFEKNISLINSPFICTWLGHCSFCKVQSHHWILVLSSEPPNQESSLHRDNVTRYLCYFLIQINVGFTVTMADPTSAPVIYQHGVWFWGPGWQYHHQMTIQYNVW